MSRTPSRTVVRSLNTLPGAVYVVLGAIALGTVGLLFVWDAFPRLFPPRAHDLLAAIPLASIALAYLVHQRLRRTGVLEAAKAVALAIAFLFWAANQLWPDLPQAIVFNDLAIALFVIDVFLTILGAPSQVPG
jgi:hypothetical protein